MVADPTNLQNWVQIWFQIKNQPNKGSGSSPSVSKTDQSSLQPGNNLKYYPNGNPGGSGSGNTGPEAIEWETKASCPNPDEIISNINFWNSYLNSKDLPQLGQNFLGIFI